MTIRVASAYLQGTDSGKRQPISLDYSEFFNLVFFSVSMVILLGASLIDYSDRTTSYVVSVLGFLVLLYNALHYRVITRAIDYIWPCLFLSLIGLASFALSKITGSDNSYGAAIIPMFMLLFSCMPHPPRRDSYRIGHHFHMLLIGMVVMMLFAHILGLEYSHQIIVVAFYALSLSVAMEKKTQIIALVLIIGIYTLHRPSSTIVVCLTMTLAVAAISLIYKPDIYRIAKIMVLASSVYSILIMLNPHLLQLPLDLEQDLKQGPLAAHSNSEFRLAVIESASDSYHDSSLIFGTYFTGSINAQNMESFLPWWQDIIAPIHSDFSIIVLQGGIFGASLLAFCFIKLISLFQVVAERADPTDQYTAAYCHGATLAIMNFLVFANFNPMMASLSATICLYALVYGASFMAGRPGRAPS